MARDTRPLLAHIVHCGDDAHAPEPAGTLAALLDGLPDSHYRQVVVALGGAAQARWRVVRPGLDFITTDAAPALRGTAGLAALLHRLAPALVHTHGSVALAAMPAAVLARVPVRVHSDDDDGAVPPSRGAMRQLSRLCVHRHVAASSRHAALLTARAGVAPQRIVTIARGVDTAHFTPRGERKPLAGTPFAAWPLWIVGYAGRLRPAEDPVLLVRAFARALELAPDAADQLRLVIAGEGPQCLAIYVALRAAGLSALAWMPGEVADPVALLHGLDSFVCPSVDAGDMHAVLQAMSCGLPVIAAGPAEALEDGRTARVVAANDVHGLARALLADWRDPGAARARGERARREAEQRFGLARRVRLHEQLYAQALQRVAPSTARRHGFV